MNSLVVLFSVMVLAAAKPSFPAIISYAAPAVALAPAAVSHQSRIDVKSSPAIIKTEIVAPALTRVVADPAVVAPIAYSAPLAVAPAAVSTQSRIDIKSSPAIVSTFAAGPFAYSAPLAYNTPLAYSAPLAYGAHLTYNAPIGLTAPLTGTYTPSIYTPAIESAEVKTAPIAPVAESTAASEDSVDVALPVAPTETPEVAAARAAHLEAKALEESHRIQKRSVGFVAATPLISSYPTPIVTKFATSPIVYSSPFARIAPVAVSTPVLTGAYGVHHY